MISEEAVPLGLVDWDKAGGNVVLIQIEHCIVDTLGGGLWVYTVEVLVEWYMLRS